MSRPRLIALLLALATLLVYLPVVHDGFVNFDDQEYVTENHPVLAGLTWDSLRWAFTSFHAANWHPLTWLSHMLDCELFGPNPGAHHFVNVLFHAANAALLFVLLLRLTNALWPAAIVAALFAWHPLHVESVAWVAERKDVLSTFFALLALLSYTRYAQSVTSDKWQVARSSPVTRHSSPDYWFALIFFALGLMAKPMLVTLPFVILLLDYWPLGRVAGCKLKIASSPTPNLQPSTFNLLILEKWPFFLLAAGSCIVTYFAQRMGSAVMTLEQFAFGLRLQNALIAYARYLLDTVWPLNLAVLYPLPRHVHLIHAAAAAATVGLLMLSWFAWRARTRYPYVIIGWLWFLGTLVPVIGLVKVGSAALADRYTYFPLIGIFLIAAFGARDLAARFPFMKKLLSAAAILILAACVGLTERQLTFWRDSETLFRRDLAVATDNASAHINLGAALEMSGRETEALAEYREAARLADDSVNAHFNLGNLLTKMNQPAEALPEFARAIALAPNMANLRNGQGEALAELGKFNEAESAFAEAARLDPDYAAPHFELGKTLLKQGRDAEAIGEFRAALRLDPDNFKILAYVAHVLAAVENPQIRDGRTALVLAIKANTLTGGVQPLVLDALGMACAETGDFTNAADATQKAFDLANAAKLKKLEPIRQRLELYKNHQPWRESFLATNNADSIQP
jgi:protein O-mannosyl-transferase